jgi:DNA polymerase-3 subunit delta
MKYQNLKLFEKSLSGPVSQGSCRVYMVQMASDQERSAALQKIVQAAVPQAHSLERFSSDVECREIFDALLSPSLFGGEVVVLLDECEALRKKEVEKLSEFLEKGSLSGYLLLGARGKTPLSKIVEKMGILLDMTEEKPWDRDKRLAETLADMAKLEGKWLSSEAIPLLIESVGHDISILSQELKKLVCYVGDRPTIERSDIFRLCGANTLETPWQIAEEIVWEGKGTFDIAGFPGLIFSLRSQLQLGLKITTLLDERIPASEWTPYFPKIWPRTLDKRKVQAEQKGAEYFKQGLEMLYKIESLSRMGSMPAEALFDLFRTTLNKYAKR